MAATPSMPSSPPTLPIPFPMPSTTWTPPRCSAPASSATAPCAAQPSLMGASWPCTDSDHRPTLCSRSPNTAAVKCQLSPEAARTYNSHAKWALTGPASIPPRCRRRPTAPSVSPPLATSCPPALKALKKGGVLALAGIYMTDIPPLNYEEHVFYGARYPLRHRQYARGRPRPSCRSRPDSHPPACHNLSSPGGQPRPPGSQGREYQRHRRAHRRVRMSRKMDRMNKIRRISALNLVQCGAF